MSFKATDCVIHMPQRLAGMDERMDNSCKRRTEYLHRSLIIVYTERGQWQASFIWKKSVCLLEVRFRKISEFPEILGKLSVRKQCVPGSVLCPRTRAWEQG